MKKILLASAITLAATNVYASKARLEAFGEDMEGSQIINDSRNIFQNPVYVNKHTDIAVLEWGDSGQVTGTSTSVDSSSQTKAQGGFIKSARNFNYGVHVGNETNESSLLRILADPNLHSSDNVIDLFLGTSKGNMDLGLNLVYSQGKDERKGSNQSSEDQAYGVRAGMAMDKLEAFIQIPLKSESTYEPTAGGTKSKYEGNFGVKLGSSYDLGRSQKVFGEFTKFSWEQTSATNNIKTDGNYSKFNLGYAKTMNFSKNSFLFTKVSYDYINIDLEFTTNPANLKRSAIPLTIGFETNVKSWLTLRGSVTQNLYGKIEEKNLDSANATARTLASAKYGSSTAGTQDGKKTLSNSTNVAAGASLLFGNLTVDGLVGTDGDNRGAGVNKNDDGILSLDNLLTRVGVTYKF